MAGGFLAVAALPAFLLWSVFRPLPWDANTLRVRFESVHYRAAALVFTYEVENRAWRSLRLAPDQTEIRLVPADDQAPTGYPSFPPLLLEGHATQKVELRIDLPAEPLGAALAPQAPDGPYGRSAVFPDALIGDALRDLGGFELVNPVKRVRLVFPRGW